MDWVPGVTACELDGSVRRLHLPGAGDIAEEIKVRDEAQFRLVYQCIESPNPWIFMRLESKSSRIPVIVAD